MLQSVVVGKNPTKVVLDAPRQEFPCIYSSLARRVPKQTVFRDLWAPCLFSPVTTEPGSVEPNAPCACRFCPGPRAESVSVK